MRLVQIANVNEYGHVLHMRTLAYEVRLTSHKPEDKWRKNHIVMCLALSMDEAIRMACDLYPNDPVVNQAVLRNAGMDVVISENIISQCEVNQ